MNAEKAIASVEGVNKVDIDLASGIVSIEGNTSFEEIKEAVEPLGYKMFEK